MALFSEGYFTLRTDQHSVTFIFDTANNEKKLRWRAELMIYPFEIK